MREILTPDELKSMGFKEQVVIISGLAPYTKTFETYRIFAEKGFNIVWIHVATDLDGSNGIITLHIKDDEKVSESSISKETLLHLIRNKAVIEELVNLSKVD